MIIPGLVSVTFRKHTASEVVTLAKDAGLKAIEWGADVHTPVGDITNAEAVGKLTVEAGLTPISLGSYFWIAHAEEKGDFADVIATAKALGATNIRSWAGRKASADVDDALFAYTASEIARYCDEAKKAGLTLSLEYHPNTLTDTKESAVRLAKAIDRENLRLYWQPNFELSDEDNIAALKAVQPWLGNVHVFSWLGGGAARYPLAHSEYLFKTCAELISADGREHGMLLEFVKGDSPEQMAEDAATLLDIIG